MTEVQPNAPTSDAPSAGGCGGCGCGAGGCGGGGAGLRIPELDARAIPPELRNSAIFGCLIGMAPGAAMILVIDQDPHPLVELVDEKMPQAFAVDYLVDGPDEWHLSFLRRDGV